ncbi:MAG TPA: aminopeptidase P family protein, partial [Bacteroidia bacterium]|nr:aminopeptidase P family protein [Bacteroidia bacterium]
KQSFSGKVVDELLFIPKKNISQEIWNGLQAGPADASALSGIQLVQTSDAFSSLVFPMSSLNWILRMSFPKGMVDVKRDETDLFSLVDQFKLSTNFPSSKDDDFRLSKMLTEMREIKQPAEIKLMRKAIELSCEGHKEMMRGLEPGMSEYSIQAIGEYVFKSGGAETFGYPSICGGGENSCILHYESNRRPLYSGDLILLDMGGEYHGYSADITRTLPVNGKFTTEQKEIYKLVYQAQTEAFDKCKPGNRFHDPHNAAMNIIATGLLSLGITKNLEDAKTYFMHNTSHYLGLDVHDPGSYAPLKEGNVITIEPGIYIPKGSNCDSKWWNIGIRIEDDVLITSDGYEILSGSLPSKWEDVEKLMEEKSFLNK